MPDVTTLLCVHNGAEFLAAAVDSALAQVGADFEVVVVDDGSTDATPALLAGYGDRLRVVRQPNRGTPAARNAGIAVARGRFIALLDADDIWEPAHLARALERFASLDDGTVGVCASAIEIGRDGAPLGSTLRPMARFGLRELVPNNQALVSGTVLRRAAVLAAGGFDPTLRACEDWDLWIRLALQGGTFVAIPDCLWRRRVHADNMSNDPERMAEGARRVLDKLFAHAALPDDLRARRAQIYGTVAVHTSWEYYRVGREADGAAALRTAAAIWPDILLDDETHYAIICADQVRAQRGTAAGVDLERSARRIAAALAAAAPAAGADSRLLARAHGRAARALSQLAYRQRQMRTARRYARQALRADPSLWRDPQTIGPLLKSVVGMYGVETLSRWRRGRR